MTRDDYNTSRAAILMEMSRILGIDFTQYGHQELGADEIRKKLSAEGKYSEDAIEDFILTARNCLYIDKTKPDSNSNYVLLNWSDSAVADMQAFEKWQNAQSQVHAEKPVEDYSQQAYDNQNHSFSIQSILNQSYPHTEAILYEEYLSEKNAETFGAYTADIAEKCDTVNTLVSDIDSTLAATSSLVFYNGTEASKNVGNLKKASDNATGMRNAVCKITEGTVLDIVKSYNRKLKEAKEKVRIELLQKKIKSINGREVSRTSEKWIDHYDRPVGTIYTKKVDGVYDVTLNREFLGTKKGLFTETEYHYLDTTIQTIAIPIHNSYRTMESNILKVGEVLPYQVGKIIE